MGPLGRVFEGSFVNRASLSVVVVLVPLAWAAFACGSGDSSTEATISLPLTSSTSSMISVDTSTSLTESTGSTTAPTASATIPIDVPDGRVVFHRKTSDSEEQYFTINTDGTDEQALFTSEFCACARWSPDGSHVWTLGETSDGTFSFMTIRPDGTEPMVVTPPIDDINLAVGASSADGGLIVFNGWDDNDPSRAGVYAASPDLSDLHMVTPAPDGTFAAEPIGMSTDGSVIFFGEEGTQGFITHAGGVYVVDVDGTGLRKLNPPETVVGLVEPDESVPGW